MRSSVRPSGSTSGAFRCLAKRSSRSGLAQRSFSRDRIPEIDADGEHDPPLGLRMLDGIRHLDVAFPRAQRDATASNFEPAWQANTLPETPPQQDEGASARTFPGQEVVEFEADFDMSAELESRAIVERFAPRVQGQRYHASAPALGPAVGQWHGQQLGLRPG
jgi:hypothetical protein